MWRFVLPGAGVVGMTLLLLAGSLASWSLGGTAPSGPSAPSVATPAMSEPAKPTLSANAPKQSVASPSSEEDAMRLALAALASVPSASAPSVRADAALPPEIPAQQAAIPAQQPAIPAEQPAIPAQQAAPAAATATAPTPATPPLPPATSAAPPSPSSVAAAPAAPPRPALSEQAEPSGTAAAIPEAPATNASPVSPPERDSFASVETLVHRLRASHRREAARAPSPPPAPAYQISSGDRLAMARALLASGGPDRARPLLEAAAAQLGLQSNAPNASGNPAAARIDDALRWLSAGQPARALGLVDSAIATLDQGNGFSSLPTDRRFARQVPAPGPDAGLW
jgi:hypothetical protein